MPTSTSSSPIFTGFKKLEHSRLAISTVVNKNTQKNYKYLQIRDGLRVLEHLGALTPIYNGTKRIPELYLTMLKSNRRYLNGNGD